jgi:hypothetical protein
MDKKQIEINELRNRKIAREKRYSLSICEQLMKEKFSLSGWEDEHSFTRHKFHAEKIAEYNKILLLQNPYKQ